MPALVKWLLGIASALIVAAVLAGASALAAHSQRIVTLEVEGRHTVQQLDRIESKLDHLLEQRYTPNK